MLPSIKITLPLILVAWCAGAIAAGLTPLLVYPLLWVAVGGLLFSLNKLTGGATPANDG